MGANLSTRRYPDKLGKDAIIKRWQTSCEISLHEDGNSYSGGIGMLRGLPEWHDIKLDSEDSAEAFIADNHDKWGAPVAVSYSNRKGELCWLIGGWCSE
jgi:hypothetical protein